MRSTIAYYLLLIYVTVAIKPLIPFIHDAWDHQFNEIEHISLVHAKYGSNHLEKELAGSSDAKGKDQNALRSEDQVAFHILTDQCRCEPKIVKQLPAYGVFKQAGLPYVYTPNQGQPPEIL